MNRHHFKSLIAVAALAAAPAFGFDQHQPIDVNTDGLQSHVAEQVRKHAADSAQALMQYLWFTRRTHHLWIDDVSKPKAEAVAKTEPAQKRQVVVIRTYGR